MRHTVAVHLRRRAGLVADHQHHAVGGARIAQPPRRRRRRQQRDRAVQPGHVVAARPLQGQPARVRVRPGLAAAGAGRVAVRAEEHQTPVVPQVAPKAQHRH